MCLGWHKSSSAQTSSAQLSPLLPHPRPPPPPPPPLPQEHVYITCPLLRVPPALFLRHEDLVWKTLEGMQARAGERILLAWIWLLNDNCDNSTPRVHFFAAAAAAGGAGRGRGLAGFVVC